MTWSGRNGINEDGPFSMNVTDTNTWPIITAYLRSFCRENQIYIWTKLQMQPTDHHKSNKFEQSEKKRAHGSHDKNINDTNNNDKKNDERRSNNVKTKHI